MNARVVVWLLSPIILGEETRASVLLVGPWIYCGLLLGILGSAMMTWSVLVTAPCASAARGVFASGATSGNVPVMGRQTICLSIETTVAASLRASNSLSCALIAREYSKSNATNSEWSATEIPSEQASARRPDFAFLQSGEEHNMGRPVASGLRE